jgi:hypothetical protein
LTTAGVLSLRHFRLARWCSLSLDWRRLYALLAASRQAALALADLVVWAKTDRAAAESFYPVPANKPIGRSPPIESKTQLNTQIGGIEVGRLRVAERSVAERLLSAVYVQIFVKGWQGHFGCCLQYATVAHSQIPVLTAV